MSSPASRAITAGMLPSEKVQPKLRSVREFEAFDALVTHLEPANDAEAARTALRWTARLIDLVESGTELRVCDNDGELVESDPLPSMVYRPDEGDEAEERRWTVKLNDGDRTNLANVRTWLDGCESWWDAISTVIVRMGEICGHLERGCELWATDDEGHSYRMVIL